MRSHLLTAHIAVGLLGLLAFVLSGQFMHFAHQHLVGMPDGPRMLYRTGHIYLLWSSLLNLVLGCYGNFSPRRGAYITQILSSLAVMTAPFLLLLAFLTESGAANLERPSARLAIYLSFAGVLFHTACHYFGRRKKVLDRAES